MKQSLLLSLLSFFSFMAMTACVSQDAQRPITLRIGEAVNFATGSVSKEKARGDMVFMYLPRNRRMDGDIIRQPGRLNTKYRQRVQRITRCCLLRKRALLKLNPISVK